ncbi:DUF938 domain-containing protein [Ruegeria arenilitoris]|uniref:DUF938 domain-containing protein n=1 Tax=Ruegeria arenilitoris TaxID=1173585 RepID=UPI0014803411|nr:DUF938 domain-containing protein [Ruegeria arenilitoris]
MGGRKLPPTASVASQGDGAKMIAPAASRNTDALCTLLAEMPIATGNALELASGTGQHVAAFARIFPDLTWQPSEIDPARRASIDAYGEDLPNIIPAVELDATLPGWHHNFGNQNLIILINLLHLISWKEARNVLSEAALALGPGGRFVLYGPFMRQGKLISDGDRRFHADLTRRDPEIGYKDDSQISNYLESTGLRVVGVVPMPANTLAFVAEKPSI